MVGMRPVEDGERKLMARLSNGSGELSRITVREGQSPHYFPPRAGVVDAHVLVPEGSANSVERCVLGGISSDRTLVGEPLKACLGVNFRLIATLETTHPAVKVRSANAPRVTHVAPGTRVYSLLAPFAHTHTI